jgi:hypothetical protein
MEELLMLERKKKRKNVHVCVCNLEESGIWIKDRRKLTKLKIRMKQIERFEKGEKIINDFWKI